MATLRDIVVDCRHAPSLARFWAEVLDGYEILPYDDEEIERLAKLGFTPESDPTVAMKGPGPGFFFQQVPGPKTVKNRLHLDINVPDRLAEVKRLVKLGASVYQEFDEWTTMLDPEGNEFCVFDVN